MPRIGKMPETVRKQRITLQVQDIKLPLRVLSTEEAYYRQGVEDLNHTFGLYRQRYPLPEANAKETYLAMAAIDLAYRSQRWRAEAQTRHLREELQALSDDAERVYREHKTLLEHLLRDEEA